MDEVFRHVIVSTPTTALTRTRLLLYCPRSLWKCTAVPKVLEQRFAIQDSTKKGGWIGYGIWKSEVVRYEKGFWIHSTGGWPRCVRALHEHFWQRLQEPGGRTNSGV